jgi:hypothetical protein
MFFTFVVCLEENKEGEKERKEKTFLEILFI